MAVDFSRFSNTDFNTTPFQYVIFGAKGGLLEVELNEAQYLGFKRDYLALKSIGNVSIGATVSRDTDSGVTTFTGDFVIDGYAVCLNDCVINTNVGDTIYAKVSLETLTKDSTVKKNGYVDGETLSNTIIDNRVGIETSRRKAIKLELSTTHISGSIPIAFVNNSGVAEFSIINSSLSDMLNRIKSDIDDINNNLIDLKMLGWTVPKECPVQNYVDSNGVFHQIVGRVDLGSLEWKYETTWFHAFLYDSKPQIDGSTKANIYCSAYDTVIWSKIGTVDKTIGVTYAYDHSIGITDSSYTDATTFKNAMKGVYLYYELAEEKTIKVDGNEAVTSINESLDDYGLGNKFDGNLRQGFFNDNAVWTNATSDVTSNSLFTCKAGDVVIVKASKESNIYIKFFDSSKNMLQKANSTQTKEFTQKAPTNAVKFAFSLSYSNIKPSDFSHVGIYINNEIDQLKNDLDAVIELGSDITD